MLIKIPLIAFLIFGFTYPIFFWLTVKNPIKHNFHRFHLACPVVIAGIAIISLWFLPIDQNIRTLGLVWLAVALLITGIYWKRENVKVVPVTILCLGGLWYFAIVYSYIVALDMTQLGISILSGLIVSAIFYAMNLGHFYLNVHGLPIEHLKNATKAFGVLMALRLVWDVYYLCTAQMMYGGQPQSVLVFMNSIEGFMLWVAIFFGTLFPLCALYFAFGTLKLKNTQATTGILYVLLSAVLLGDLAYKYYLIKYAIAM